MVGAYFLADNYKTYWGAGKDASIYYDATNLVINPKNVGSGVVNVLGGMTIGAASTNLITLTGRAIFRTAASDPQDATPASRPAGSVGEIVYYNGKMYFCVNAATPVWELITSS
jgi:hypothetical protein